MAEHTNIAWCDSTLNLMMGCDGCELWNRQARVRHCYAGEMTDRRAGSPGWPNSFEQPKLFLSRLDAALRWSDLTGKSRPGKPWLDGLPRLVFLNDMGDTFTESLPLDWLAPLLPRLAAAPHHWLLLTKRPRRMAEFSRSHPFPVNFWLGTSVTSRANLGRIADLQEVRGGRLLWVSFEPLLEHLWPLELDGLSWVVVGGESGPGFRPLPSKGVYDIDRACEDAGIPFFFKQSAGLRPETGIELYGQVHRALPVVAL